uniref:28S ribosomal protein S17, mitochondrial-like n=1 Tax=Crassostrea virginica TaxID=6565 RepID=A0A8B8E1B9_CRAVI|nr:28S ribosomal protein S17, mitochondrial-like [Crassostrea virginica]XP_022345063.1 28S ribosomal protein S17, mitochondrial-like [Crassostrea virginica]
MPLRLNVAKEKFRVYKKLPKSILKQQGIEIKAPERTVREIYAGTVMKRSVGTPETLKVRVLRLKLDTYITKYFYKRTDYWALEKDLKVKIGDLVLIRLMDEAYTPKVKFEIFKYIHQIGEMICPVTGRGVRALDYIDPTRTDHIGNFPENWQGSVMENTLIQNMRALQLSEELNNKEDEFIVDEDDQDGETEV